MSGMPRIKRFWTDADLPSLSWHDNCVHGLRVVEGKGGDGELVLDIDHIVEWIESDESFHFRVAPAELRFRNVSDLRITLDSPATSATLAPFTLDRVDVDESNHWTLKVNWPVGEISFSSAGFTQHLTGEPVISAAQAPDPAHRIKYIAIRELGAFHPERGTFAVTFCIGQPYFISEGESACPVALFGLHSKLRDQHGADAFQALMLAQKLTHMLLTSFVDDGGRLLDVPDGTPVDVAILFQSGLLS
jgi:hypothetical protein